MTTAGTWTTFLGWCFGFAKAVEEKRMRASTSRERMESFLRILFE
jgi:hypothetical protein